MKKIVLLISLMMIQASGANSQTTVNSLNATIHSSPVSGPLDDGYIFCTKIVSNIYR